MTRSDRMGPVQQVLEQGEQARARELRAAQQRLADAEARLDELKSYHGEYQQAYRRRAEDGTRVNSLRDFQAFLARLELAVNQQEKLVAAAREQTASQRRNWQGAARQVKAVATVVDRWRRDEARAGDRREQKETDERAQRAARKGSATEAQ